MNLPEDLQAWEQANEIQTFDGQFYQFDQEEDEALREQKPWKQEYIRSHLYLFLVLFILRT